MTSFQSTVDKLLTQKLQMLGGAADDENDSDVNSKLIRLLLLLALISAKLSVAWLLLWHQLNFFLFICSKISDNSLPCGYSGSVRKLA